jgi:hypothetical protein
MSDLVVVAFPTEEKAEEVRQKLIDRPITVAVSPNRREKMKVRHLTWPRLGAFAAGLLLAAVPGLVSPAQAQAPAQKPNIMFIMGDDIGWMQPSIYHVA